MHDQSLGSTWMKWRKCATVRDVAQELLSVLGPAWYADLLKVIQHLQNCVVLKSIFTVGRHNQTAFLCFSAFPQCCLYRADAFHGCLRAHITVATTEPGWQKGLLGFMLGVGGRVTCGIYEADLQYMWTVQLLPVLFIMSALPHSHAPWHRSIWETEGKLLLLCTLAYTM